MLVCKECHEADCMTIKCDTEISEHTKIDKSYCDICNKFTVVYRCVCYSNHIQRIAAQK